MTRKDYINLALALKAERPGEHWDADKRVQWTLDVKAIARVCERDNPRFKTPTFFTACGGLFDA